MLRNFQLPDNQPSFTIFNNFNNVHLDTYYTSDSHQYYSDPNTDCSYIDRQANFNSHNSYFPLNPPDQLRGSNQNNLIVLTNKNSPQILDINLYYQNVRGLKTKLGELTRNIPIIEHGIYLLTETWLSDSIN